MMARLITMPEAPPSACRKRRTISCGRLAANAQPMVAITARPRPPSSTGLRPYLSESGPITICEIAMPTMNSDTVICAIEISPANVTASVGRAGTSM